MAGVMTLADLQNELRYGLNNRDELTPTQLTRWLQWSYQHVSMPNIFRHRELQATQNVTTVNGTYQYTLNDDVYGLYTVRNNTVGMKVRPRTYQSLQEMTRHSGRPAWYALWNRQLVLFPTPDSANAGQVLDVNYWKRPGNLATSGPASILGPEWDEVIVEGAKWRGWRALNRYELALEARESFAGLINEVTSALHVDGEDSGYQIEIEGLDNYMFRG